MATLFDLSPKPLVFHAKIFIMTKLTLSSHPRIRSQASIIGIRLRGMTFFSIGLRFAASTLSKTWSSCDWNRYFKALPLFDKGASSSMSSSQPEYSNSSLLALAIESPSSSLVCCTTWFPRHGVPRIKINLSQGFWIRTEKRSYSWDESDLTWYERSLHNEFWHNILRTNPNLQWVHELLKDVFFRIKCFLKGLRSFRFPLKFPPCSKSAALSFLTSEIQKCRFPLKFPPCSKDVVIWRFRREGETFFEVQPADFIFIFIRH